MFDPDRLDSEHFGGQGVGPVPSSFQAGLWIGIVAGLGAAALILRCMDLVC